MKKKCEECGKEFEVDETKRNWMHKKLCSAECQRLHSNKKSRLKYTPIQWPQKKICLHCGNEFLIHEGGNMAQKYCDMECQLEAKQKRRLDELEARKVAKVCECCGIAFVAGKFTAHKQRFCSLECRIKSKNKARYKSGTDRAKIRNTYKYDFKQLRPQVIDRDGNKCTICGSTEQLHAHHWDNSGGTEEVNNDMDNLVTLCVGCHNAIHKITLVQIAGEWKLDGKIFELLGLTGELNIKQ